jgi:hypothetical protein
MQNALLAIKLGTTVTDNTKPFARARYGRSLSPAFIAALVIKMRRMNVHIIFCMQVA